MIGRRDFIKVLGGAAAAWPLAARAQQAGRVWRIGVLEMVSQALNTTNMDAFQQGLRALGYVEGKSYTLEYRSSDGDDDRFFDLASELVRLNVDLIVTRGTPAALAAKKATNTVPIVMAASGDPLSYGLIPSLARPGGNITGLSALTSETFSKRIELLKELVPTVAQVSALLNMSNPGLARQWSEIEKAARKLGIQPQLSDIRRRDDIERAFDAAGKQDANALIIGTDTLTQSNSQFIVHLAEKHRIPALYASIEFIAAGGLFAYGANYPISIAPPQLTWIRF
jgi:putative ABC transport system substrate-binding protein